MAQLTLSTLQIFCLYIQLLIYVITYVTFEKILTPLEKNVNKSAKYNECIEKTLNFEEKYLQFVLSKLTLNQEAVGVAKLTEDAMP